MNADDFQKAATEWIAAGVIVGGLLLNGYITLKTKWDIAAHKAEIEKEIALNKQQTEQNTARLNGQSGKIDTLMLQAPAPVPVVIAASESSSGEPATQSC